MRMQPMSLDNLMMLKDEDEDDDDDDDDDDDEVDRVYEDTEEQIWEENGSHEPDPTKREISACTFGIKCMLMRRSMRDH